MAHYAFLNENNVVTKVIPGVPEDELIEGETPEVWYGNFCNQVCKRTSYNTYGGEHKLGGTPYRKNYAGKGYTYDETRDAFIPPQPFPSWTLNETTCLWEPPVAHPDDGGMYQWNEDTQSWDQVTEA